MLIADGKGGANPGEKRPGLEDGQAKMKIFVGDQTTKKSNLELEKKECVWCRPLCLGPKEKKRQTYP